MAGLRRSEVLAWLHAHGGQKGEARIHYEEKKNPKYEPNSPYTDKDTPPTIREKHVTWVANDGQSLEVIDPETPPDTSIQRGPDPGQPGAVSQTPDPEYQVVDIGPEKRDPNEPLQNAYDKSKTENDLAEAQANLADPNNKRFETNAQKAARLATEEAQQRARRDQEIQEQNVIRQQNIDQRAAEQQAVSNEISRGNLTIAQQREAREAAAAEREGRKPTFLSQANPDNPNIAMYDPTTGEIKSVANPNYDAIKVAAERKRQELTLAIQIHGLDAADAKQEYDQWFDTHVRTPIMLAQEARATAADQRAAMQAEEQRNQFAADFGLRSAQFGQQAGQAAVQNELQLLPYSVGPTFGAEMSSAINSLAHGGRTDGPRADAGINFSPGAFTFQRPDFEKIASKATAKALSHLTGYHPTEGSFPAASAAPNIDLTGAPSGRASGGVNLRELYNQLLGTYQGPAAAPAPPPAEPAPTQ